jgi:hypothetical protein
MADNGTVGRVRTMYVKDTSERMKKLGNEVNAILQKPKGQVTKDELGKALENTEKMRTADPPLTHVEELNRLSMHRGLVERAGGEGLMTPQEIKNRPDSMRFALGAPGGGGAGGIRKSGGTGPMLPKTGAATGQKPLPAGGGGVAITKTSPPINHQKQEGHIKGSKHHKNREKQGNPTSTFENRSDAEKYTKEAWEKGTDVPNRPGVKDYEFGRPIGESPNGGTQSRVRVHMNSDGEIHGHPVGPVTR